MITIDAKGIQYERLISVECGASLGALARDFSIVIARPENRALPFSGGEAVKILIDNELFIDGNIFRVSPTYSKDGHTITMSGRSKAADFIDSSLTPFSILTDVSLESAIQKALTQLNSPLTIVNNVSELADFLQTEDKIGASVGENAFAYANKLALKRQVLLTSDASGNIVIDRTGTEEISVTLNNLFSGGGNIIDGAPTYDISNRFGKYFVQSQVNESAGVFAGSLDPAESVNQIGGAEDQQMIDLGLNRQFVQKAEKASSSEQCQARATWQGNIRRAQSRNYPVTVQGVRPKGGSIWEINKLVPVNDEYAGINEIMLIDSVRFHQSRGGGTLSKLSLVDRNSYNVSLQEPPPVQKKENPFGL